MAEFVLFHTEGCHLCHLAEALLQQAQLPYVLTDICNADALAARYGERIPVLKRAADGAELGWPFGLDDLIAFKGV